MNARKASVFVIFGLIYTLVHKLVKALFPGFTQIDILNTTMSFLWILATATIILFAVYFLKEGKSTSREMKVSLIFILIFTGLIIIFRFPFGNLSDGGPMSKLMFRGLVTLNAASFLMFLISMYRKPPAKELKQPAKLMLWGFAAAILLGIISLGGYIVFISSNTQPDFLLELRIPAVLVFGFLYITAINFLYKFSKLKNF